MLRILNTSKTPKRRSQAPSVYFTAARDAAIPEWREAITTFETGAGRALPGAPCNSQDCRICVVHASSSSRPAAIEASRAIKFAMADYAALIPRALPEFPHPL